MIKRLLFMLLTIIAGLMPMTAATYEYPYLSFLTVDGKVQSIAVDDLTITMSNGSLTASNGNATKTFTLTKLDKMFFSESSGLEQLAADNDEPVEVFDEAGISFGKFANVTDALHALDTGVYVLKSRSITLKIAVK